jgi:hypothetical protein
MDIDARTQTREEYNRRLAAVWSKGEPHCPSLAHCDHAVCVLPPNHPGKWHEGNGYDMWGPKYRAWKER